MRAETSEKVEADACEVVIGDRIGAAGPDFACLRNEEMDGGRREVVCRGVLWR